MVRPEQFSNPAEHSLERLDLFDCRLIKVRICHEQPNMRSSPRFHSMARTNVSPTAITCLQSSAPQMPMLDPDVFTELQIVNLERNKIHGMLPRRWFALGKLYQFDISRNDLEGFDFEYDGDDALIAGVSGNGPHVILNHNPRFRHLPARMETVHFQSLLLANTSVSVFDTPWRQRTNATWSEISVS